MPKSEPKGLTINWKTYKFKNGVVNTSDMRHICSYLLNQTGGKFAIQYQLMTIKEILTRVLTFCEDMKSKTDSYPVPANVVEAMKNKIKEMNIKSDWMDLKSFVDDSYKTRNEKTEICGEIQKQEDIDKYIPNWLNLSKKEAFAKLIDKGERLLLGQIDGTSAIIVHGSCKVLNDGSIVSRPASPVACAVSIMISKISKIIKIEYSNEKMMLKKQDFINLLLKDEIKIGEIRDSLNKNLVIEHLVRNKNFITANHVLVERAGMKSQDVKSIIMTETNLKNPALMDAGKAFLFSLIFGLDGSLRKNYRLRNDLQCVMKMFNDPNSVRLNDLVQTGFFSAVDRNKKINENRFTVNRRDILDDSNYIEGMNDVKFKILENAETIEAIVNTSDISQEDKEMITKSIKLLEKSEEPLIDIILKISADKSANKSRVACITQK